MNSVRSNNLSLKYKMFSSSCCKDILIKKVEFYCKDSIPFYKYFLTKSEDIFNRFDSNAFIVSVSTLIRKQLLRGLFKIS